MNTAMTEDDDRCERKYDDFDMYEDFEEKHGRGGFEKSNKNENMGKYSGKKKIKPRQLTETDIY